MNNILEIKNLDLFFKSEEQEFQALYNINLSFEKGKIHSIVGESGCGKTMTAMSIMRLLPKNAFIKNGEIIFKDMLFHYPNRKSLFNKFDLTIRAGEKVGLVGISGSGKSTLISLLQRFYEPQKGQILIDNQDISNVTQDSLRKSIAVIPQDTSLFHRSIYENIAYGNPKASEKKVIQASKMAHVDDFVQDLPMGYESMVGERGLKVSGGQRQRIAVARAILKNAPILILDEATSALDSESEMFIQKGMKDLMNGKTVIAIAHRLSTLKEMDRIIVMTKGKIIEQGKPKELLEKNGAYAHLWKIQTKGWK